MRVWLSLWLHIHSVVKLTSLCVIYCFSCVANSDLSPSQRTVALISEMIHTASLMHDDVIDGSYTRRGHPTVQQVWGQRKVSLVFVNSAFRLFK